jgi:4a-hydroxytetrahydrobiopterin dehydratase
MVLGSAAAVAAVIYLGRTRARRDLDWRYNRVFLRYTSHDAGGEVTARDVGAAEAVSEAAAAVDAVAEPAKHPAAA